MSKISLYIATTFILPLVYFASSIMVCKSIELDEMHSNKIITKYSKIHQRFNEITLYPSTGDIQIHTTYGNDYSKGYNNGYSDAMKQHAITRRNDEPIHIKTLINTYNDLTIDRLFLTSAASAAVYSLVTEFVADSIRNIGYSPRTANYAATLVQAGIIAYTAHDYVPTLIGTIVRIGCDCLDVSQRSSAIASSTATVVTSVVRTDMTFEETISGCVITLVGSFVGSTWALHAKDWVCSFWPS